MSSDDQRNLSALPLRIVPTTQAEANEFVRRHHRHHQPLKVGYVWRIAGRFFPVPEQLATAWYSQGCPTLDVFDRPPLSLRERLNWRISMWLRECHTWHGWTSA